MASLLKILSKILVMVLMFSPVSLLLNEAISEEGPKLVNLFCEEIVSAEPERGPAILESPEAWERFARRLESRISANPGIESRVLPAYQACVRSHRDEFELGEFVLKGKRFLEEEKESGRLTSPSLHEQKGWLEQEVSLPLVGKVQLRPGREFDADPVHQDNFHARHAQYGELWNRFLDGVRDKARVYRNTIQLVKNFE